MKIQNLIDIQHTDYLVKSSSITRFQHTIQTKMIHQPMGDVKECDLDQILVPINSNVGFFFVLLLLQVDKNLLDLILFKSKALIVLIRSKLFVLIIKQILVKEKHTTASPMTTSLNHSSLSAFKPFTPIISFPIIDKEINHNSFQALWSDNAFREYVENCQIKQEIQLLSLTQKDNQKDEDSSTDSSDNVPSSDHTSNTQNSIGDKIEAPKKRKNKQETKQEIQEKQKDQGRGGNCIASNITKTLIRVTQNRLQNTLKLKFKALIEKYKIKSQKENTIIIILILYDLVKTQQMSISIFENIFSFFMKSLNESKENCEKKMADEPERKGFHLKNRKMYVNFININREIYSKLAQALRESQPVQMELKTISDIISDTYDRKQRQIQKALSKIKSIILNHASLKALFGHEQNDIEGTLFEAIDYAYRRNLEKRCNQTKKKVAKFINETKKNQPIVSEEDHFFMCYAALKLVGEKEEQIWEQFAKSTNLKRQYNQTEQEGQKLGVFLNKEIPNNFSRFESQKEGSSTSDDCAKMQEETEAESGFREIFRTFISSRNDMEF